MPTVGGEFAGDFVKIKGIMEKEDYHSILERYAIPSGNRSIGQHFGLQQDNDAKMCSNYLKSKEDEGILKIMTWTSQSRDHSIEIFWDEINREIRRK